MKKNEQGSGTNVIPPNVPATLQLWPPDVKRRLIGKDPDTGKD